MVRENELIDDDYKKRLEEVQRGRIGFTLNNTHICRCENSPNSIWVFRNGEGMSLDLGKLFKENM